MSKRTKAIIIVASIVAIAGLAVVGLLAMANQNKQKAYAAVIEDLDLSIIADGTYSGEYSAFPVVAKVDVVIKDHAIIRIDLVKHQNGQGGEAEAIPQNVVDAQSLMVDTVSGATFSSKVILLAIQDALNSAAGE